MMNITEEQLKAIRNGECFRFNQEGTELVVVRADVFAQLADAIDLSPWTDDEMDLLAAEDADALGWEGMEAYQDGDL